MNHHYVPQFYLSHWADPDGRIPNYRWLNRKVIHGHIPSTKGTGFEPDLYAREHVPEEDRHKVETHFFSILDNKAALLHARFAKREAFDPTAEERTTWAMFLAAANARTPDVIAKIKKSTTEALREKLNDNPEEVEERLGYKPPFTLVEWVEQNAPDRIANFGLHMLIKHLTRPDHIQRFMDMVWTVHEPQARHKELLTCDRPLWYFENPEHPQFTMMMTLSPKTVFIASKTNALAEKMVGMPPMRLVRRINESVFNRANERVYGRTSFEYAKQMFRRSRR